MRIGPFAVWLLPRLDEHSGGVRVEVGLATLCVKPYQLVAKNEIGKKVSHPEEVALMHPVAHCFEFLDIDAHLRGRNLFVDPEAALAHKPDGHRLNAVVMAGSAPGILGEIEICA